MKYYATDKNSVASLASNVALYKPRAELCTVLITEGFMRAQWQVNVALAVVGFFRGAHGKAMFMHRLMISQPSYATAIIDQTVDHIVNGKDRESKYSVGGFSQREIDHITSRFPLL